MEDRTGIFINQHNKKTGKHNEISRGSGKGIGILKKSIKGLVIAGVILGGVYAFSTYTEVGRDTYQKIKDKIAAQNIFSGDSGLVEKYKRYKESKEDNKNTSNAQKFSLTQDSGVSDKTSLVEKSVVIDYKLNNSIDEKLVLTDNFTVKSTSPMMLGEEQVGEKVTTVSHLTDKKGKPVTKIEEEVILSDGSVVEKNFINIDNETINHNSTSKSEEFKFKFAQKSNQYVDSNFNRAITGMLLANWDNLSELEQKTLASKDTRIVVDKIEKSSLIMGADLKLNNHKLFPSLMLGYSLVSKNGTRTLFSSNVAFGTTEDGHIGFAGLSGAISTQLSDNISVYFSGEITPLGDKLLDPNTAKLSVGATIGLGSSVGATLHGASVSNPQLRNRPAPTPSLSPTPSQVEISYGAEPTLPSATNNLYPNQVVQTENVGQSGSNKVNSQTPVNSNVSSGELPAGLVETNNL